MHLDNPNEMFEIRANLNTIVKSVKQRLSTLFVLMHLFTLQILVILKFIALKLFKFSVI